MKKMGAVFLLIEIAVLAFVVINTAAVPERQNMDAIYLNTEPAFILQEKENVQSEETSIPSDSLEKLQSIIATLLKNFSQNGKKSFAELRSEDKAQDQTEIYFSICPYAKNCKTLAA
jgi:hypothetical protein